MTVSEMLALDRDYLTPAEVAGSLGCTPYSINQQAEADPKKLGFPIIMVGRRVKIPRIAYIRYMRGDIGRKGKQE